MSYFTHYQEITLLPDADIGPYFIWEKLFTQVHIALADLKNKHGIESIGVAFPDYYYDSENEKTSKLGNKLRVFALNPEDLDKLNLGEWLSRLDDYTHVKSVKKIPEDTKGYVSVHRYRFTPKPTQANRLAKKLEISFDDAMETVEKRAPERKPPFIKLSSSTNNNTYFLKVLQKKATKPKIDGDFNSYGMNGMTGETTVPVW